MLCYIVPARFVPFHQYRVLQLICVCLECSGQLYAINMQYGVGGARTNAVANLLVFSLNSSGPPRATDFAVQLGDPAQTGNVSVLSTYSSPSDYLIRVTCLHKKCLQCWFPSQPSFHLVDSLLLLLSCHEYMHSQVQLKLPALLPFLCTT